MLKELARWSRPLSLIWTRTLINSVDLHAKAWQDAFRDFRHQFELKAVRDQIGKGGDHLLPVFLTREEIDTKGPDLGETPTRRNF